MSSRVPIIEFAKAKTLRECKIVQIEKTIRRWSGYEEEQSQYKER